MHQCLWNVFKSTVIVLFKVTFSVRLLLKDMEYVFIKYHHQQISNLNSTFYSLQSESFTWFIVKCNAPWLTPITNP